MKKFLLTGVALAALASGSALAADLPARRGVPVKAPEPVVVCLQLVRLLHRCAWRWRLERQVLHVRRCRATAAMTATVGSRGGQVGFNYADRPVRLRCRVLGQLGRHQRRSHLAPVSARQPITRRSTRILMLTGRVGMTFDRMLIYVTGGGAWARDEVRATVAVGVGNSSSKQEPDRLDHRRRPRIRAWRRTGRSPRSTTSSISATRTLPSRAPPGPSPTASISRSTLRRCGSTTASAAARSWRATDRLDTIGLNTKPRAKARGFCLWKR